MRHVLGIAVVLLLALAGQASAAQISGASFGAEGHALASKASRGPSLPPRGAPVRAVPRPRSALTAALAARRNGGRPGPSASWSD